MTPCWPSSSRGFRPSEAIISGRKGYRASKGENAILGRVWLGSLPERRRNDDEVHRS